jgi:hypothetical protein
MKKKSNGKIKSHKKNFEGGIESSKKTEQLSYRHLWRPRGMQKNIVI